MDGINQTSSTSFIGPSNHWYLCANTTLTDGEHSIALQIQVPEGQQFWFDYMQYVPSFGKCTLDDANIYINNTDPDITYGMGWINPGGLGEEGCDTWNWPNAKFSW